ncbi:MAG: acylphosphatase [Anaerolineales bacterium]|nr:acylphosphatase [Anaerolineales bacterium]MCW5854576.1 acylphosphatase [Anaerolineales bacterium]
MSNQRLHILISGHVQGVGFRYFVMRQAQELGLSGWTRNLHDGHVEAVAEGPRPALERLLVAARQGPPGSAVSDVQAEWGAATGEFSGFEVVG